MKQRLAAWTWVVTVSIMAFAISPSYAGGILYSISRDDDLLRRVNPSTGATISSVAITLAGIGVSSGNGLATHPVTGQLFALLKLDGQTGRQLVTINPTTGVATSIGDTGDQFAGLAFNSSGTLYGVIGDKKNVAGGGLPAETLFMLNTSNAAPTQVLVLGRGNDGEAIGFNPNDGLIYHASGNDTGGNGCAQFDPLVCVEIFESVNPNTLAVTNVPLSGDYTPRTENYVEVAALTHDSGTVLLLTDVDQNLYKITTTGVVTFVGSMDHTAKGLAFRQASQQISRIGVFRPSNRTWYLDLNGNGQWDGCGADACIGFGMAGDVPVAGDWTGTGQAKIGVYREGTWYLDLNGNGQWDGCGADACIGFGMAGDVPVAGDWTGTGQVKIGVYRDGTWYLDLNGNGQWDGCGADACIGFGMAGDMPVAGDWTGTGQVKIGVYRDGTWYLDLNGNGQWDGCGADACIGFGMAGDMPVAGDWTGTGQVKIGVYRDGTWYLDLNGNGQWDGCGADVCIGFGMAGDVPVAGDW